VLGVRRLSLTVGVSMMVWLLHLFGVIFDTGACPFGMTMVVCFD
jgi:hypothetical protein